MTSDRFARWLGAVPLILGLGLALSVAIPLITSEDETTRIDVRSDAPRFGTLDELLATADLVVHGRVTSIANGRTVTSPSDPDAGFTTQLSELSVMASSTPSVVRVGSLIVVEQEATLPDGTPISVDGVEPFDAGMEVVVFLVRGDAGDFPYTTTLNAQGVFVVKDGIVDVVDADDPIGSIFAKRPLEDLLAVIWP